MNSKLFSPDTAESKLFKESNLIKILRLFGIPTVSGGGLLSSLIYWESLAEKHRFILVASSSMILGSWLVMTIFFKSLIYELFLRLKAEALSTSERLEKISSYLEKNLGYKKDLNLFEIANKHNNDLKLFLDNSIPYIKSAVYNSIEVLYCGDDETRKKEQWERKQHYVDESNPLAREYQKNKKAS